MNKINSDQEPAASESKIYDVPVAGSLGLLALGAKGIEIWRKKRDAYFKSINDAQPKPEASNEKE